MVASLSTYFSVETDPDHGTITRIANHNVVKYSCIKGKVSTSKSIAVELDYQAWALIVVLVDGSAFLEWYDFAERSLTGHGNALHPGLIVLSVDTTGFNLFYGSVEGLTSEESDVTIYKFALCEDDDPILPSNK